MADATTATTPKIEELRARLKADPKSRHFYPLAEELRKIHQLEEAEQILREGIQTHVSYLSAWISLGRVLRDRSRDHEAVEVLKRALVLDPGNVVAAKLLAQAYLGVGDKVEAIKKFKLVFALMPSDEDVEESIRELDRELNPDKYQIAPAEAPQASVELPSDVVEEAPFAVVDSVAPPSSLPLFVPDEEPSRFDMTDPIPFGEDEEPFGNTADSALPGLAESPPAVGEDLDGPLSGGHAIAADAAEPAALIGHEAEPFGDFGASPVAEFRERESAESEFDGTQPVVEPLAPPAQVPATMTMARLYENQGHDQQAAELYRQILEQQPDHELARVALSRAEAPVASEGTSRNRKRQVIDRLEQWRAKVIRT